jgi:hypothetical protein
MAWNEYLLNSDHMKVWVVAVAANRRLFTTVKESLVNSFKEKYVIIVN